jgi:hypothetical protein
MPEEYPWYVTVEGNQPLMQGDFVSNCPVVVPSRAIDKDTKEINAEISEYDVIIMSQSCDLVQGKLDLVLLSPFWELRQFENQNGFFASPRGKEELRRGNVTGYHLLNKCVLKGFETDFLVVDFRTVYSVPLDLLIELAQKNGRRLRLKPPYREHLSQAFARFFMRVGLPVDIPAFR